MTKKLALLNLHLNDCAGVSYDCQSHVCLLKRSISIEISMGKTTSAEKIRKMRENRAVEPDIDEKKHQLEEPLQTAEQL